MVKNGEWEREGEGSALPEPVAQLFEFGGQRAQFGDGALGALQHAGRNRLGTVAQRTARGRQGDAHTALVLHITQPGNQGRGFQALEQRGERARVEER